MATYYVDATDGDDAKDGLSEANAWKTISKVNGETFAANDNILFQRGEAWSDQLVPPNAGTAGNPITFGDYGSGTKPTFDGVNVSAFTPAIDVNVNYITLNNLRFTDVDGDVFSNVDVTGATNIIVQNCDFVGSVTTGHAVFVGDGASQIEVLNCTFTNLPNSGVRLVTSSGQIRNVFVEDCDFDTFNTAGGNGQSGVQADSQATQDIQFVYVRRCTFTNGGTVDIGMDGDSSGGLQQVWIEDNTMTNSGDTASVGEGIAVSGKNIWVRRNTITGGDGTAPHGILVYLNNTGDNFIYVHDNSVSGIESGNGNGIFVEGVTNGQTYNEVYIYNNQLFDQNFGILHYINSGTATINSSCYYNLIWDNTAANLRVDNISGPDFLNNVCYGSARGLSLINTSPNVVFKNNIVDAASTRSVEVSSSSQSGFTADYNCYNPDGATKFDWGGTTSNFANWKTNSSQDGNSISADPLFVDATQDDFHIQSGSPCRDAGTPVGLTQDFWGNPVPK